MGLGSMGFTVSSMSHCFNRGSQGHPPEEEMKEWLSGDICEEKKDYKCRGPKAGASWAPWRESKGLRLQEGG